MNLRQRLGAVFCAATASVACGSTDWELDVAVRIPVAVQSAYTGGYPAQLVVVTDSGSPSEPESTGGTAQRVANLCSASDQLVTIHVKLTGSECAPRYVRAWLERREIGAESKCGTLDPHTLVGVRKPPFNAPQAQASEFAEDSGSCLSGQHAVNLTLSTQRR